MRLMAVCYGFGKWVGGCGAAVCCLLFARCRQLYASCMPAAVGRKIKYRFPAWQAPEVFSKRQPLIFSHYLCLYGSFFYSRVCGIYVRPRQYSCLRPSGRCRVKRPFSTTFSSHFHNGSISRDSVPLRHGFFRCALAAGLLCGLTPPFRFHNGSVFRGSVPLRHVHFRLHPCCRSSARHCPSVPFPQRQRFPRFGAVAVPRSGRCRPKRPFSTTFSNSL